MTEYKQIWLFFETSTSYKTYKWSTECLSILSNLTMYGLVNLVTAKQTKNNKQTKTPPPPKKTNKKKHKKINITNALNGKKYRMTACMNDIIISYFKYAVLQNEGYAYHI